MLLREAKLIELKCTSDIHMFFNLSLEVYLL